MNQSSGARFTPSFFYGWVLVLVLLLLVSLGMGTGLYMYSLVAGAITEEFAASRMVVMSGSMGMMLVMGLSSPLVGKLIDRYPSERVLIAGALIMGLGFIVVALSPNVWVVVASYILFISIGFTTLSLLAAATLISRWFVRHRGLAIGFAALGTQVGGFFYPPLFAATMETYDWRVAIGATGVLVLVVAPLLIWFFVIDRPEKVGQSALGAEQDDTAQISDSKAANTAVRMPFIQLLKHRNFLMVILIASIGMATNTLTIANLSLLATDIGETQVRGAFLLSLIALLGVFSSPFLGWLSDRMNLKAVVALLTLTQAISCLIFAIADNYALLALATFFAGMAGGGVFPIFAALVSHLFDNRIYGQVMGTATLCMSLITAAALLLSGLAYDISGSYHMLFLGLLVLLLLALGIFQTLARLPDTAAQKFGFEHAA